VANVLIRGISGKTLERLKSLAKQHNRSLQQELKEISGEILNLPLNIIPSKSILQLAIDIGIKYGITVYDAVYVSVAKIYETKLVTADERLVDKLSKTPLGKNIEWLGEYMNYGR
jgi:predicted nucleic acid-binding protein